MGDLGSNFQINFQKHFRAACEKVPTIKLEHHLAQFSPIVGITQERIRAIWEMLSEKCDQHFGAVSMTKYNIIVFHWIAADWELRPKTKNLRSWQMHTLLRMLMKYI